VILYGSSDVSLDGGCVRGDRLWLINRVKSATRVAITKIPVTPALIRQSAAMRSRRETLEEFQRTSRLFATTR